MKTIELTKNKVALVDDSDYDWLNRCNWFVIKVRYIYYAARAVRKPNGEWTASLMHREIMQARKGQQIDHRNGNGLDNQWKNLRFCTRSQNGQNSRIQKKGSSKYKGVCWNKQQNVWHAYITHNRKLIHLGCYKEEIEAAKAYDAKAYEAFGEFARLNLKERMAI